MNKVMLLFCTVLVFLAVDCSAFSIFDGLYKKVDNIKEQTNQTQAELGVIKDNQIKLESSIQAAISASIQAEMKAQAGAIVGIGNKLENIDKSVKVQGDLIKNTQVSASIVNDPLTWQIMSGILSAIIMWLLKDSRATKIWLQNALASKSKEVERGNKYKRRVLELMGEKEVEKIL